MIRCASCEVILLTLGCMSLNSATPVWAQDRPNVLILMADQLNTSALSCYGGPVPTPHLDRLARQGVRFTQAVCPTPFCSPTRASMITGMVPHAHGIVNNCSGGHGMVWKSTSAFYDEVARVPLLIRHPRRFKPQVSDLAVDLTDLMPTLLHLTGQPIPPQAQGQNLVPFLTGQRDPATARPYTFSERVPANRDRTRRVLPGTRGSFMIRGQGWKYVRYAQGDEYVYDLANDPGETHNLAAEPHHRARRDALAAALNAWLRRTG